MLLWLKYNFFLKQIQFLNFFFRQIRTFIEMDSHEERIHELVEKNKMKDVKAEAKRKQKVIFKCLLFFFLNFFAFVGNSCYIQNARFWWWWNGWRFNE